MVQSHDSQIDVETGNEQPGALEYIAEGHGRGRKHSVAGVEQRPECVSVVLGLCIRQPE